MADEHAGDGLLLRAEGHADADFADALGDGAGDDAVDADDAEKQRHSARDREHDERERSASHGAGVVELQGVDLREREIGIDGPDGFADFLQESFVSRRSGLRMPKAV